MRAHLSASEPDPGLVREAQAGSRSALKRLIVAVDPTVRGWALAQTGDPDEAADLSQEVLVLLVRKLSSYRGDSKFTSWLFAVTRNQALEARRRKGRQEKKVERYTAEGGAEGTASPEAGEGVDRERLSAILGSFLEELPARQREVFHLSELKGLSSPEVGEILGVKPVTVRAALMKARKTLRRRILEQHPEFVEEYLG